MTSLNELVLALTSGKAVWYNKKSRVSQFRHGESYDKMACVSLYGYDEPVIVNLELLEVIDSVPNKIGISNVDQPAFACVSETFQQEGLTKREYFSGLAMQGFTANIDWAKTMRTPDDWDEYKFRVASGAVELADAILAELAKK